MSEHNFEIGDKVSGVRNGSAVWYGTVTVLCGHGIECWEQDFCAYIYIPNHMLYTLTNVTKQQKFKEQQMSDLTKLFDVGDEITVEVTAPMDFMQGYVTYVDKHVVSVQWYSGIKIYNFELSKSLNNITKNKQTKEQQMKEQNIKQSNIKPEDEVTITVTYRDLAKMYALLGSVSCTYSDHRLFYRLEKMLDTSGNIRDKVVTNNVPYENRLNYKEYQEEFEALLFPEPIETEQQKQIRELREQAEALLQKAKEIESSQK